MTFADNECYHAGFEQWYAPGINIVIETIYPETYPEKEMFVITAKKTHKKFRNIKTEDDFKRFATEYISTQKYIWKVPSMADISSDEFREADCYMDNADFLMPLDAEIEVKICVGKLEFTIHEVN